MFKVLGYDIGGANTKAAYIEVNNNQVVTISVLSQFFPIWKNPTGLFEVLLDLKRQLHATQLDALGVTMTAELSDAYQTKREGVHNILSSVTEALPDVPMFILNSDAELVSPQTAKNKPLTVASANWAATGWLISRHIKDAVVVDIGSTSTSIIPIINGHVAAKGKTDLEKLVRGELVYTGSLRTNIAAIVHSVPIRGGVAGVSSELFATSGDVHLLLGHISEADFSSETADGRGKSLPEAMARLCRVICADAEMLSTQEIMGLAQYVYDQQIEQIVSGLRKVYADAKSSSTSSVPVVVTGLGKSFLARRAAEVIGASEVIDLDTVLPKEAVLATPAVGVACMAVDKAAGAGVAWL